MARLTSARRRAGIARENAMQSAMQTAAIGEDPMAVLARAQTYTEFILGSEAAAPGQVGQGRRVALDRLQPDVKRAKAINDRV